MGFVACYVHPNFSFSGVSYILEMLGEIATFNKLCKEER